MRTLKQNITEYLRLGVQPRTFVRVVDDATGEEILLAGTKAQGDYEDRLDESGVITQSIDPAGGMASVSGCTVKDIILDKRLTFCVEASLAPRTTGVIGGAGRLMRQGNPLGSYSTVRNAASATDYQTTGVVAGRSFGPGTMVYTVWRGPMEFSIPADVTTCENGYIELAGMGLFLPSGRFRLIGAAGSWSSPITTGAYKDFSGWAASGDYQVVNLLEDWTTDEYPPASAASKAVRLRLNEAGRAAVVAAAGKLFRLLLLSDRDPDWADYGAGPSGNEYVQFEAGTSRLKLRYNTKSLDNQRAEIYIALEPVPADHTGMELIWSGVVDDHERDDEYLTLTLAQNDFKKDCMVPGQVINGSGIYAGCHESVQGKAVPVVYGDFFGPDEHRDGLASFLSGATPENRYSNGGFVKAYIYENDANSIDAIICGHVIQASDFFPALYEAGVESFAAVAGDVTNILSGGEKSGRITISKGTVSAHPYNLVTNSKESDTSIQPFLARIPTLNDSSAGCLNPENSVDADALNWTNLSVNGAWAEYQFGMAYGVTSMFDNLVVCLETYAPNGYGSGACRLYGVFYDDAYGAHSETHDINTDGQHLFVAYNAVLSSNVLKARFSISAYNSPSDGSKPIYFRNLCVLRGFPKEISSEIYLRVKGIPDNAQGTVTGTGGALIEKPAHVIESIGRLEMKLSAAEINAAAFDAASVASGAAVFAFQLLERARARDLLKDLGRQAGISIWWDEADALKVWKIDTSKHFPHSGTDIPGPLDIFDTTGNPVNGVCTTHMMLKPVRMYRMGPDEVKNDYVLKYAMNYATGEFTKVLTVNRDGHNLAGFGPAQEAVGDGLKALCLESYRSIRTTNTCEVEAWAIRDDQTALLLLTHLVNRLYRRRWKLDIAGDIDAIEFELTDYINVRDDGIYQEFGDAVAETKKWMIIDDDVDVMGYEFGITAIEV